MRKVLLATFLTLLTVVTAFSQSTETKCPEISVAGPAGLTMAGDVMVFSADIKVLDGSASVTYEWKVTVGIITDGQGTNQIRVQSTAEDAGSNVTATVTIKGLPEKCSNSASEVASVAPPFVCGLPLDEYGAIRWPEEQARLDNLLIQINHNPKSVGYFYIQIESGESVDNTKKHIGKILKHFRQRDEDFDLGRLRFAIHKGQDQHSTRLNVFPEGAELPKCDDDCTLVNGKHLYP